MYLKSLELHGFKSFPEKTVLNFNAGTTVIVGPNGSGKSNITDAMRWVLGELSTKNIRGSKMEDVIFIGADGHRPMGFAEVSVTFDDTEEPRRLNSPYNVVTVTRRYYRAGESEYFINRKPCRLKDIYELFLNTGIGREGYSIIGQGKIAEIISKKSDDRRGIFEETAGISKFRYKKQESQKKLAECEDNMVRITDIYTEIESRIGPLERDAKKARRYLELYGEKKELDIGIWRYDFEKLHGEIEKTSADCKMSEHELEMADDRKNEYESKNERLYNASVKNKEESRRIYEEIRDKTGLLHVCENEISLTESEILHTDRMIEDGKAETERILLTVSTEEEACGKYLDEEKKSRALFDENEKEYKGFCAEKAKKSEEKKSKEKNIADKLETVRSHEAELSELTVKLEILKNTLSTNSKRSETLSDEIENHEKELSTLENEAKRAQQGSLDFENAMRKAKKDICDAEERATQKKAEISAEKESLDTVISEIGALESRIGALKRMSESFDGYNNSVKYVMNEAGAGRLTGIYGPVSSLIGCDDKYIIAIETALGANLQNIIVEDETSAKSAMYSLKRSGSGRATFYPVSTVKSGKITDEVRRAAEYEGFVGYADKLLKYDEKYRGVIEYLLARIPIFKDIDSATSMARSLNWRVRAVTLDGQQVNVGGSFTGGSVKRDSGVLSRNSHIKKLESDKEELLKEKADRENALKALAEELDEIESDKEVAEGIYDINDALLRSEKTAFEEKTAKISVKRALISDLKKDADGIAETNSRGSAEIDILEASCKSKKDIIEKLSAERLDEDAECLLLEEEIAVLTDKCNALQIAMTENRKDAEQALSLASEATLKAERARASVAEKSAKEDELKEKIKNLESVAKQKKEDADSLRLEIEKAESLSRTLNDNELDFERRINELRKKLDELNSKKELLFIAHTKNENKLENLNGESEKMVNRLWDEYELTTTTVVALDEIPEVTEKSRPENFRRLAELKSQIKSLGHVNPESIEEYAKQKERYEYLKGQITDLNSSKGELEKIISSIEDEMRTMFVDTFNKVNDNFREVFKELFGGGDARISLSDPENPLTSGIEISAAPPGKMIKNLSLLSGGEQAFVAIALLFALIKVNPSPFCIFDEIEAALDEVNVSRVANYVKRYSKELQMIVISHRRGMMEVADSLYGVTMPRRGVSKVFVLDVDSVSEKTAVDGSFVE